MLSLFLGGGSIENHESVNPPTKHPFYAWCDRFSHPQARLRVCALGALGVIPAGRVEPRVPEEGLVDELRREGQRHGGQEHQDDQHPPETSDIHLR